MFVSQEARVSIVAVASLTPAPWNPRSIDDPRFENLCQSLAADPGFLQLRPILATIDGTVFAGNMRLRAAQHLGWTEVPAILENISEQLAKERAMRDNAQWGEWQDDELASLLADLREQGSNLDLLGFDDRDLRNLLNRLGTEGGLTDPDDDAPPLPEEPITKPRDLYLLGEQPAALRRLEEGTRCDVRVAEWSGFQEFTFGS
ncbi:MAG: ParB/RepB/Spo0J family partition protein [Dehalococcoidia bacterium]